MEEGKFFENEILSDDDITVADRIIGCSIKGGHGLETTEKGFWNSCNPIFVQLAQRVGLSPFYNYVRGFGLMNKTGIDLPGEGIGLFHAVPSELDMSCLSFGEQSTVTPLAMITSYCAFANGGYLMQPRAVSSLTDSDGNVVKEYSPETVRRVVSEETATRIRSLLKGVVLYGTGKNGYVEGYSVGGKTSTSTREDGKNNISFLSMAPVDQPEICILVILFAPSAEYSKSSLAALTSAKMTSRILEYLDVDRSYTSTDISTIMKQSVIPDLTGKTFKQAQTMLQTLGFNIDDPSGVMGDETVISYQWPAKDLYLHKGGTVAVYSLAEPDEPRAIVPNILGKNVNECMRAMTESGINIIIEGDCLGTAISQEIQPGEMVLQRSVMKVVFSTQELEEGTDLTPATTPAAAS
jgi:stage V sporulation protein D (sporulation-specific penicillin-binding protein)